MFEEYLVQIVDGLRRSGMTESEALQLVVGLLEAVLEPSELLSRLVAYGAPEA